MSLNHKKWHSIQDNKQLSFEADFYNNCSKLFQKFAQNKTEIPNNKIYHYTSVEVLMKILKTRSLWMSDFKSLNTRNKDREIIYALEQLENLINENCYGSPYKEFWDGFLIRVRDIPSVFNIYICSYCLGRDHRHVWENYADNNRGVAIGFDTKYFFQKKIVRPSMILTGQKVHYHTEDFRGYVLKLFQIAENALKAMKISPPFKEENSIDIGVTLLVHLIPLLSKLKEPGFSEENEYRTSRMEFASDKIVGEETYREYRIPPQEKIIRITEEGNDDKAIYKFKRDELSEIWLGPKCTLKEICIKKILHGYQYTNVMIQHI